MSDRGTGRMIIKKKMYGWQLVFVQLYGKSTIHGGAEG
jgi:hypothetical protein